MRPDPRFSGQPKTFWAHVRTISQLIGYTERNTGRIREPGIQEIRHAMERLGLKSTHLLGKSGRPTSLGELMIDYFNYRASVLNDHVRGNLMDVDEARKLFEDQRKKIRPNCPIPMNKQKGEKKAPAYFTALANMLIEKGLEGAPCDFDPRELTTITKKGVPIRTLARRVDGAFPSPVNPVAVWEIKEYYYTTTFGSRVADGVYESLLDGMELEELREHEKIDVLHYLMVDAKFTWWECGKSYLCRIIDMLHMGYVDEVLFGRELLERLPILATEWREILRRKTAQNC